MFQNQLGVLCRWLLELSSFSDRRRIGGDGIEYGLDTVRVDENDIFAVREVTKEARRMALEDDGKPVLIEAMSYRVSHHSINDNSFAYRAKVEVEDWKRRDNSITMLPKWM